jgi:hypothetical protein
MTTIKRRAMKPLALITAILGGLALVPGSAFALNESEALTTALKRAAPRGGLQVQSSGASTFGHADAVFSGEEISLPPTRRDEAAYPFTIASTEGEQFRPLFAPQGHEVTPEPYESVVVSANWPAIALSPTPPLIQHLGTVVRLDLPSGAVAAGAKSCRVAELLASALTRKHLHARAASAASALKRCEQRR